jgi:hypothetical protein
VHQGLVGEVSRSLILDGEQSLEPLPGLKELICPTGSVEDKSFAPFIHYREVAGQPVTLIGETFPVGQLSYKLSTLTGMIDIAPDPDPLPQLLHLTRKVAGPELLRHLECSSANQHKLMLPYITHVKPRDASRGLMRRL